MTCIVPIYFSTLMTLFSLNSFNLLILSFHRQKKCVVDCIAALFISLQSTFIPFLCAKTNLFINYRYCAESKLDIISRKRAEQKYDGFFFKFEWINFKVIELVFICSDQLFSEAECRDDDDKLCAAHTPKPKYVHHMHKLFGKKHVYCATN